MHLIITVKPGPYDVPELSNDDEFERGDILTVGPNCTEIKGGLNSGGTQTGGGTRGKICEFSHAARLRMMKRLSDYYDDITHWQHLTFADEIFNDMTFADRVELSSYRMKLFSQWYKRQDFGISLIWRREYEPRKSGGMRGELIPHFHIVYVSEKPLTELQIRVHCMRVAAGWWRVNRGPEKMLKVNIHPSSWQKMNDPIHAARYVSKYIAKETGRIFPEGVSLGRFWGKIGDLPEVEMMQYELTNQQSAKVRRYLRRLAKSKGYGSFLTYRGGQKNQVGTGFLFVRRETVMRIIEIVGSETGGINAVKYRGADQLFEEGKESIPYSASIRNIFKPSPYERLLLYARREDPSFADSWKVEDSEGILSKSIARNA